jgi:hypothetical protein
LKETSNHRKSPVEARSPVDAFLDEARKTPVQAPQGGRGRLIFALDATMSRQPTWDLAQILQGKMFETAAHCGGLDVQLVYFRGFGECRASRFVQGGAGLGALMSKIDVRGGHTQIGKVLKHVAAENAEARVGAFVYIGDAMEEKSDDLAALAGQLGLRGVKGFIFQEGADPTAAATFKEIARLTGGAYAAFDANAAARLAELLQAAAAYAAGGLAALQDEASRGKEQARLLLRQMR